MTRSRIYSSATPVFVVPLFWSILSIFLTACIADESTPMQVVDAMPQVQSDAQVPDPVELVIATFNVKQFFDTVCDSSRCTAQSFEMVPTASEFEAKARQLAQGIQSLNADVLLLQEIESDACLTALRDNLGDTYQASVLGETNGSASLDVAVISRFPIAEVVSHRDRAIPLIGQQGNTYFTRDFLEVHLEVEGASVVVFNAHFRSKYPPDDPAQRLAEASAAQEIVSNEARDNPDALVVLGGDLNDVPGSAPINAIEAGRYLTRVATELGVDAATYIYRGEGQAIDHLYLAEEAAGQYLSGTAQVVRNNPRGLAGSDHGALVGTFSVTPLSSQ
ncbi:MAG: endonuclease/exonuclease/phosphatase family protein [Bradymonadia bacterium]